MNRYGALYINVNLFVDCPFDVYICMRFYVKIMLFVWMVIFMCIIGCICDIVCMSTIIFCMMIIAFVSVLLIFNEYFCFLCEQLFLKGIFLCIFIVLWIFFKNFCGLFLNLGRWGGCYPLTFDFDGLGYPNRVSAKTVNNGNNRNEVFISKFL